VAISFGLDIHDLFRLGIRLDDIDDDDIDDDDELDDDDDLRKMYVASAIPSASLTYCPIGQSRRGNSSELPTVKS